MGVKIDRGRKIDIPLTARGDFCPQMKQMKQMPCGAGGFDIRKKTFSNKSTTGDIKKNSFHLVNLRTKNKEEMGNERKRKEAKE